MPYEDHIAEARDAVTCAVLTISDTRTEEDDKSGKIMITRSCLPNRNCSDTSSPSGVIVRALGDRTCILEAGSKELCGNCIHFIE